ncbi:MAG: phage major capsid protein [Pseudomonadota bacterium]|nr:phage major capsid protein [Pseudomonadota bacterium]MDP1903773.1 phage major capsid protein [Pseudomonadota bacterium]MDP2353714.1 phage major capsid protein [Pseudomonadota bacterium]
MPTTPRITLAQVAQEVRRCGPLALATTFAGTPSGQDGGYSVPADTASEILMPAAGALLPLCTGITIKGGSLGIPLDATSPWTENGIRALWQDEADQLEPTKPNLSLSTFRPKKLTVLVPVSDELLEDSDAMSAWLPLAMQAAVTQKINDAIINGIGAARPLGILNSSGTIVVSGTEGQPVGTITERNLQDMLDRHLNPAGAIWITSTPFGQTPGSPTPGHLAGLPVFHTFACPPRGNLGDIVLADMSAYIVAMKGPQLATSVHLWFDQDLTAFRLTVRLDGMPALGAPVTPTNSAVSKSHFVTLASRD